MIKTIRQFAKALSQSQNLTSIEHMAETQERSQTTVGNMVRKMQRSERNLAHSNAYLENEIKKLSEELRQGKVAHQVILSGLAALSTDPALTEEERVMATFEIHITDDLLTSIISDLEPTNDPALKPYYIKPGVTMSDIVTPDAAKVVEMMKQSRVHEEIVRKEARVFREGGGDPTGAA